MNKQELIKSVYDKLDGLPLTTKSPHYLKYAPKPLKSPIFKSY